MLKNSLLMLSIFTAVLVCGCRKQVSTLMDVPRDPVQKAAPQPDLFKEVDTTDEVSFVEADLASELASKVKENLNTIHFEFNSFSLNEEAVQKLLIAAKFLNEYNGIRVLIQGHCDERGSSEYNMGLGERRARAVRDYLLNLGIMPIRIEVTSLGKEMPLVTGCTDESCHWQNRRAEFKVLAK
ncbi:MAG: OmpA family protein [Fibrobacter sp.]|jgi:peptidoglycan-associated lipoprotein|nr:OmpA family protein [Fibrobacter sp.]